MCTPIKTLAAKCGNSIIKDAAVDVTSAFLTAAKWILTLSMMHHVHSEFLTFIDICAEMLEMR